MALETSPETPNHSRRAQRRLRARRSPRAAQRDLRCGEHRPSRSEAVQQTPRAPSVAPRAHRRASPLGRALSNALLRDAPVA